MRESGVLELTVASPPQSFTELLTLPAVRKFLEVHERAEALEDEMIEDFISAARSVAESMLNFDLIVKQWDLTHDYLCGAIELRTPLRTVDLIRYRDSDGDYHDLEEGTDYIVDMARGIVLPPYGEAWPSFTPWPSSAVLVRFTSGYATDHPFWSGGGGKRALKGMKALISAWFNNRLPFEPNTMPIQEYPYEVTSMFRYGMRPRVK